MANALDDTSDVIVTSRLADRLHSTTMNALPPNPTTTLSKKVTPTTKSSFDWALDVETAIVPTTIPSTTPAVCAPRDFSENRNPWGSLSRHHHHHHHQQSPHDPPAISPTTRTPWNETCHCHHHFHPSHHRHRSHPHILTWRNPAPSQPAPVQFVETVRHPKGIAPTKPVIRTTCPIRLVSAVHLPQTAIPPSGHPSRPSPPAIYPMFAAQCHCGTIQRVRQEFGPFWGAPGFGRKFPRLPWRCFRWSMRPGQSHLRMGDM